MNRAALILMRRVFALAALLALSASATSCEEGAREQVDEQSEALLSSNAKVTNPSSGRCLNVKGNSDVPGQRVQIYDCVDAPNELFSFTAAGELRAFNDTRCLQPTNAQLASGAQVVIAACDGGGAQKWQLRSDSTIASQDGSLCFDLSGGLTATQTPVVLAPCSSDAHQKWSTTGSSPPPPPPPPPAGDAAKLYNLSSARCLNVKSNSDAAGTRLQIYDCVDAPNELFAFSAAGELRAYSNTRCLQPLNGQLVSGSAVVIGLCDGSAGQKWQLNGNGTVSSPSANLCFDLAAGGTSNQTAVVLAACTTDDRQKWSKGVPTPPPASSIVNAAANLCMNVKGNVDTPGQLVQIYECVNTANELFTFTAAGELRAFSATRCLQPQNGSLVSGSQVAIALCNGQPNQQWRLNANATISSPSSNLCFDLNGGATVRQTLLALAPCNTDARQRWSTAAQDTQPPAPPSNLMVSNLTCNTATLSWSAATDNTGVTGYDVYHDGQFMKAVNGSTLSTAISVVPGVPWRLYVNARDAASNVSQASPTYALTPPQCQTDTQPPTQPQGLTASASGTSVTLSWSASSDNVGVSAYDVYRNGSKVGAVGSPGFVDSGLSASTSYTYYVVARDAQSNVSSASSSVSVTTGSGCATPICSVTQVGTDTDIPWGLVTLPDGSILYARRDAQDIIRLDPVSGQKTTAGKVPNVQGTDGEGGLLGLEIASTFSSDSWLYIMHTSPSDNRVVRMKYANGVLDTNSAQVLLSGIGRNIFHDGGRLRFGPDGKLYIATGDAQNGANAQNLSNLNGKVLRINVDGTVPADNPFGNAIWSYGHRNPQGLAFDAQGRLWEQEFGNSIMDETNLIQKGGNYGWPNCEGTSSQAGSGCATAGYLAPKQTYTTAEGSCSGIAIVREVLYVACQRGTRLYREVISGSSLTNVQQFFVGTYGRLRTVEPTRDGNLWLTTTNNGDKDSTPNNSNEKLFKVFLAP